MGMAARADTFSTTATTIRRTGSSRSAADGSISRSASSATPRRSGAAPWRWRGSSMRELPGVTVLATQDFGAQPGDLNPLGYKDGIDQPAIEGSGVEPLPGQGRPIKAGEFILGYPGEAGVPLPMPQPDVLGRNGTYVGLRKYQSRVGAFNRFLRANAQTDEERELLAAKLVGRWRSGAPLTLAPAKDDPALGAGPAAEQRLQLRQRSGWPAGAARLPYAADEPARHQLAGADRREHPSHHPAQHDVWRAIRPERALRARRRNPARALLPVHQRQGDGHDRIPAAGVDQRRQFHRGSATSATRSSGLQEDGATFTIPREPVRRRVHGIETFNVLRGGEYFFMPSLSALKWLADLKS